eukprot:scaffold1169_cov120-Cylindrotheca_fusiformis.AAC.10
MDSLTPSSEGDEGAFCSVLNVVIDFSMEEPTTLEPEEFNIDYSAGKADRQQKQPQKVPVIRIFGPVLRRHAVNPPIQCKL